MSAHLTVFLRSEQIDFDPSICLFFGQLGELCRLRAACEFGLDHFAQAYLIFFAGAPKTAAAKLIGWGPLKPTTASTTPLSLASAVSFSSYPSEVQIIATLPSETASCCQSPKAELCWRLTERFQGGCRHFAENRFEVWIALFASLKVEAWLSRCNRLCLYTSCWPFSTFCSHFWLCWFDFEPVEDSKTASVIHLPPAFPYL